MCFCIRAPFGITRIATYSSLCYFTLCFLVKLSPIYSLSSYSLSSILTPAQGKCLCVSRLYALCASPVYSFTRVLSAELLPVPQTYAQLGGMCFGRMHTCSYFHGNLIFHRDLLAEDILLPLICGDT